MSSDVAASERELQRLRERIAALEQVQEAQEKTAVEQAARLERSLQELRDRACDQAASEEALHKQTRILRSVLDSMGDGVVVADEQGRFLVFNPAAEQILGIGATDVTPEEWSARYRLYLPDMVTPYPASDVPLARAIRGEAVDGVEMFVRAPHAPEGVWLSINARPLRDETGLVRGGVVVFRDTTERKRAERRLAAQHAVSRLLAESATFDEVVSQILQTICNSVGWEVAAIWNVDREAGVLRCLDIWQARAEVFGKFTDLCRQTTFRPGVGLPGRVWTSRQPAWITDVVSDTNFPRAAMAYRCGLHGAFGFPVLSGGEVAGVLEFFSPEVRQPDADLLAMFGSLGSQVGQFMDRKRAEEELRKQRERFELSVRGSGDGVWDWQMETNQVYFSPRWKHMLGFAEDEIPHRYQEWESRLHPEDRARALQTLQEYLDGKTEVYELEHRLRHKDGSYRWILARGLALRDATGRPFRMAGSHTDITDRKRMETRLRDEEALYHSLVETLPLNILRKDALGRFTFANQRFLEALGKTLPDILGKTDFDLFPDATARKYSDDDAHVMRTGELFEDVEEHFRLDGARLYVQVLKAPVHDAGGAVVGIQGIFWDVTARKLAEEELQKAKEAAEAANQAKSLFLANMSHEIRTPMNAVIGMTELVLDTELTAEQRESLETVRRSADHLLTVINDILDFSKIEAGKLDLDQTEFRLRECLGDALGTLALRAHKQGLELASRIPPEVPDGLVGDPGRLRQVLVNLVNNAIKFTEQGEVVLRVAVDEQTDEQALLHFEITDTGIGIAADKLQAIFAPFVQVDGSLTRRRGGTGLGLAISRRLVELMGGRLHAESEPGRGSRFQFTARFGISKHAPPLSVSVRADPARLRGLAVLIVDDNATNRFILEEILSAWRMRPTSVADGPQALAALRQAHADGEPFPLVLIDAHMPEMDGFMLAEHIRSDAQLNGASVIMLTSGAQPGTAARRRELGLAACLPKPIRQTDLLKTLVQVLGGADSLAASKGAAEPGPTAPRPLRILLAEDNPINQNLAVRLLTKQGHEVIVAADGKEAVAAVAAQAFDLVLMDVQMPEMDGLEATSAIRAQESERGSLGPNDSRLPIIAMTAFAMAGDRDKCLAAGMDGYITKPVRAKELFGTIDRLAAGPPSESPAAEPTADGEIDWPAALDYVGGDAKMLRDLIGLFEVEAPRWLAALRLAIDQGSASDVKRLAHNLKGSVRLFGANSAFESAFLLERMGRSGNLSEAGAAFTALQKNIDNLIPTLRRAAATRNTDG